MLIINSNYEIKRKSRGMQNIKMIIMYDGSAYAGWQRLSNAENENKSIQYILEKTLETILNESVKLIGSGRTDAGVHAYHQVANFHTANKIEAHEIKAKLNQLLPEDIKIVDTELAHKDFHSRYDATSKTYEYYIDMRERASVFGRKYALSLERSLNIDAMQEAAIYLVGTHDFKAFCTERKNQNSTIRTIYELSIVKENRFPGTEEIKISITGEGFLYNMVRILVGTLIEIGLKEREPISVKEIFDKGLRMNAGVTVSPQGLFLANVQY